MQKLVNLKELIPDILFDIKYASSENFTGKVLYSEPLAYLIKDAADDLKKVQSELKQRGYRLIIWDAYRPLAVTKIMWSLSKNKDSKFIADPAIGSIHNRGCAVDVTLQNISTGLELDMPTEFDNFTYMAYPDSTKCSSIQQQNRYILINTMQKYNFLVDDFEWWHFNWYKWLDHPVLDMEFKLL